jgi:hypothetical protein
MKTEHAKRMKTQNGRRRMRNKVHIFLALIFFAAIAFAQDDQSPPPPASQPDQTNSGSPLSDNPPISGVDQPNLEPHAAPESYLLPGLHFSESIESNIANTTGGTQIGEVTRGLGSLSLQKLWKNDEVALDYIGGVAEYTNSGVGVQQLEQFDIDNRFNWKRGQIGIQDSFSYLPEGSFGFGAYGGGGAYDAGFGSMGAGLLGASAFGGQTSAFIGGNGLNVSLGLVPRITNLGLVDAVVDLTPKSSLTFMAGYGLVHFYGSLLEESLLGGPLQTNVNFVGSSEYTGQVAYDRVLSPKDQVAVSYGYQYFHFSIAGTAFHSQVVQLMYGHRISGRMDFLVSAGPQITDINEQVCDLPTIPPTSCTTFGGTLNTIGATKIGAAGRASLRYRFPRTSVSLSYQRYDTSGSGVFAGAETNLAQLDIQRPLNRVWDLFADFGYSHNSQLQVPGTILNATSFTYGFGGVGVHRQFGRSLRAFVSYQFNELGFNTTCTGSACNTTGQRQVGSFGLDWTPRPIRLD